jgi:hypothetical protein
VVVVNLKKKNMTELQGAAKAYTRSLEIMNEISKFREFQLSAKKQKDIILDKIWADKIKELKSEMGLLDRQFRYEKFSIFTQVVKAYLTPEQYKDCWRRVDEVLENPSLLQ